jgi:hypothetical protein
MGYEPSRRSASTSPQAPEAGPLKPPAPGQLPAWRRPVVTRLGLDRTLFAPGSPNDTFGSGSQ